MQGVTQLALSTAVLGAVLAVEDALMPGGGMLGTVRAASGLCYLAALVRLAAQWMG